MTDRMGTVFLVGAGPGDPGLVTRRAARLLRRADIVVYDALVDPRLLELAPPSAERIFVGKRRGERCRPQAEINAILVEAAARASVVVRLKGGDPFVFGRGGEEALALAEAGVRFEVVPGVTAGIAAAAYAGIPLTHREVASAATLVTGHDAASFANGWSRGDGSHTLAIYMGMKELASLAARLIAHGRPPDTPAAVIEWGTYARQRTITAPLAEIADAAARAGLGSPAMVIVGDVVRLRERLDWFEARPLFGRRIVVPRSRPQPSRLASRLRRLGAEVIEFPAAVALPAGDPAPLRRALASLPDHDWLLITSSAAALRFREALEDGGLDIRALHGVRVASCGTATTATLRRLGVRPDAALATYDPGEVVRAIEAADGGRAARVLFPCEGGARSAIADRLEARGHRVEVVEACRVHLEMEGADELAARLEEGAVDAVAFSSSGTVAAFVEACGASAGRALVFAIGPDTATTAARHGLRVDHIAGEASLEGLVHAILRRLGKRGQGDGAPSTLPAHPAAAVALPDPALDR